MTSGPVQPSFRAAWTSRPANDLIHSLTRADDRRCALALAGESLTLGRGRSLFEQRRRSVDLLSESVEDRRRVADLGLGTGPFALLDRLAYRR